MIDGETLLSGGGNADPNLDHITDFQVMNTGAGWYVGTGYISCGNYGKGCTSSDCDPERNPPVQPNSRETDYFATREEAEAALVEFQKEDEIFDPSKANAR